MPVDYYEVLGVSQDADIETIKKSYKDLARKYHPDSSSENDAEERMKQINEAYSVVGDNEKRQQYDFQRNGGGGGNFGFPDWVNSVFNGDFGFNHHFNFNPRQQSRMRPNSDIFIEKKIDLIESLSPVNINITYERVIVCSDCSGVGGHDSIACVTCAGQGVVQTQIEQGFMSFVQSKTCDRCKGTGKIYQKPCDKCKSFGLIKEIQNQSLTIPLGAVGKRIVVPGLGNVENTLLRPGNLILEIQLNQHPIYKTEGYSCVYPLTLDPVEAILGGEFTIPTLEGNELKIKIPKGCPEGYREEFKQLGIPMTDVERGSLFVEVVFDSITHLSEDQKALLEAYIQLKKRGEVR